MTTFLSTAFLQQCFAMHRYDLMVKRLNQSGVVVTCRQCKIRHAARLGPWGLTEPEPANRSEPVGGQPLAACATDHLVALCVQSVDVQRDHIELGCRQCRTAFPFRIVECVTRALTASGGP